MDQLVISVCRPGDQRFDKFMAFPSKLYAARSLRLTQSENIDKANLYCCLLVYRQDELLGRLALYDNKELFYEGKRAICAGNYECVNEYDVSSALLSAAREKAKELGAEWLIGPMNGSTWQKYRFSLDTHKPYFFSEQEHKDYYPDQFIAAGFTTIARYYSQVDAQLDFDHDDLQKRSEINRQRGLNIREISLEDFDSELDSIHAFCEEVFRNNFLYTPIKAAFFKESYLQIRDFIDPQFLMLAENKNKELIGLFFSIPDLYEKSGETLITKTIARKSSREYAGIVREMASKTVKLAKDKGYKKIIHAFMHEHNVSRSVSFRYSGDLHKSYILLATKL